MWKRIGSLGSTTPKEARLSIRRRIAVLSAASIIALALALVALGGRAQNQMLFAFADTNDGFDIGVTDTNGNALTRVEPCTYTFVVRDRSTQHNFHFASNEDRTVDFRTELAFVGEQSLPRLRRPSPRPSAPASPRGHRLCRHALAPGRPLSARRQGRVEAAQFPPRGTRLQSPNANRLHGHRCL